MKMCFKWVKLYTLTNAFNECIFLLPCGIWWVVALLLRACILIVTGISPDWRVSSIDIPQWSTKDKIAHKNDNLDNSQGELTWNDCKPTTHSDIKYDRSGASS